MFTTMRANPHLRHVDVTAAIDAPNYFMRWFGSPTTHIVAKGFASRRDVVAMLVLDRSGSMGSCLLRTDRRRQTIHRTVHCGPR